MTKLRNIEFLRMFFSVAIVYYHIFHDNILRFLRNINDSDFATLVGNIKTNSEYTWLFVEAFVIISGFFLFYSIRKHKNYAFGNFALDKLFRLFPVATFAIFCAVVLHFSVGVKINLYTQFLNLLTLQSIGVNLDYKGISWFISPFFWVMLFIFGMFKTFEKKYFHFILAVLTYLSYVILVQHGFGRDSIGLCINLGVVRMLGALGLGYFLGMLHDNIKCLKFLDTHKILTFSLFSLAEIVSFSCVINWTLIHKISYSNNFIFIPIFAILIFSFAMNKGLLSKLTNIKLFEVLGQYSYSIYVMQQVAFWLLGLFLWNKTDFLHNHFALTIALSLAFSSLWGVIAYYLVERPVYSWYRAKMQANIVSPGGGG